MGLIASDKGSGDFEIVDAGVYQAICQSVIDLGTHKSKNYDKWNQLVLLTFELPTERIQIEKDGKTKDLPRVVSRRFTLSLAETSHLRPFLESWRGVAFSPKDLEGFDISKLLGVNCQINIVHNVVGPKTYANIATAMPLMKNMPRLQPENPVLYYSIEEHGTNIPSELHDWQRNIILESREFSDTIANETGQQNEEWGDHGDGPPVPTDDDSIPF